MGSTTLLLTRAQLHGCVDLPVLAGELRAALIAPRDEEAPPQRVRARPGPAVTAMVLLAGTAAGVPAYTVKVHAKNPARRPAPTGVICLHDLDSGDLLAVLDSGWLTALRTGTGAAIGTDTLARADAAHVGVIGAGEQGRAQLDALTALRRPASVQVFDVAPPAARVLVEHARTDLGLDAEVADGVDQVAASCDVLLTATWSRIPVLTSGHIRPGTHVTSLGADEPGKAELDEALLAEALVVTDDQALAADVLPRTDTTLSEVLREQHPGRRHDDQVTVYSPLGLPLQDCVIAWHAYRRAQERGVGTALQLET